MSQRRGNDSVGSVLPMLQDNLIKFVGRTKAAQDLATAFRALHLEPASMDDSDMERLAEFFVSKGGVYAFVGRAAKIRLATLLIDEITKEYG